MTLFIHNISRDVTILHAQNFAQNWLLCAELIKRHRNYKIFADFVQQYCSYSSALMAATASAKHFGVKVIKYFTVLCINAAVTGVTISNHIHVCLVTLVGI